VAFHIVVCLLDEASRGRPRGSIGNFKPFDCAGIVDVPIDKVDRVVEVLREIHWIEGHMIAEWDDRQPQREDPKGAARMALFRSRNESVTMRNGQDCDASDALHAGSLRIGGVTSDGVTTACEPDRDIDKNLSSTNSESEIGAGTPRAVGEKETKSDASPYLAASLHRKGWA
jgi:hypothetical protein